MNRSILVLSSLVDSTIKESCPTDRVLIFGTISDLVSYIESTPVRAETLYITRDVLGVSVNTSLAVLMGLLSNPFLLVDEVIYLTEKSSKEIASINFMLEENKGFKWTTQTGGLTREYIIGTITGNLRSEEIQPRRVTVFRQTKQDYLKSKFRKEDLSEKYESEEVKLSSIPYEEVIEPVILGDKKVCKLITVTGLASKERSLFAFLLAQYTSFQGKTLIVEKDFDYLTLTDMMARSKIEYAEIDLSTIFQNCDNGLRKIRNCKENLILLTEHNRTKHDYSFVCNLLYNNLSDVLSYMVTERELDEISLSNEATIVIANNVVDILKTTERLPVLGSEFLKVALVNMYSIKGYAIPNTQQAKMLIKDVLQVDDVRLQNINISSLKLGGEAHDLRMFT